MSNSDCDNCRGYRCPCTCTSDCGRVLYGWRPCPKSPDFAKAMADFHERLETK